MAVGMFARNHWVCTLTINIPALKLGVARLLYAYAIFFPVDSFFIMHYGRYYSGKLAGLFLFKVTPIVRTCIMSISWKKIDNDNDNDNNNDDDDNDENRSPNTE